MSPEALEKRIVQATASAQSLAEISQRLGAAIWDKSTPQDLTTALQGLEQSTQKTLQEVQGLESYAQQAQSQLPQQWQAMQIALLEAKEARRAAETHINRAAELNRRLLVALIGNRAAAESAYDQKGRAATRSPHSRKLAKA